MTRLSKAQRGQLFLTLGDSIFINHGLIKMIYRDDNLNSTDKAVLISLFEYLDQEVAPSMNDLSSELNISKKTIQRSIHRLLEVGYITRDLYKLESYITASSYKIGPELLDRLNGVIFE